MEGAIIEAIVKALEALLLAIVSVGSVWLTQKLGKKEDLKNVAAAMEELSAAVKDTVSYLQQTVVEQLKAAAEDGKLSAEEVDMLRTRTIATAKERLSDSARNVLVAAGVDINSWITTKAEAWVLELRKS